MPKMPPYGLGRRTRHGWRRGYRSWAGDCRHVAGDSEREQFVNPNFGYASSRRVGRRERRVARGLKVQPVVRGQELRGKTSLSFGSRPPEVIRLSRHEKSRGQAEGMGARFVLPCDGRCDGRRAAGRQVRENSLTTTARPRVRWGRVLLPHRRGQAVGRWVSVLGRHVVACEGAAVPCFGGLVAVAMSRQGRRMFPSQTA